MNKTDASDAMKKVCDKATYKERIRALLYILKSLNSNDPEFNFSSDSLVVGLIASAVFSKARIMGHTADCAEKMSMRVVAMSQDALNLMPIPKPTKCCQL